LVDPDDIIAGYGADCARWFVLSDSPPDRDFIWSEKGVVGVGRFIQRLSRLIDDVIPKASKPGTAKPSGFGDEATELRRAGHKAVARVAANIEALRFNNAVAAIYEYTSNFQAALLAATTPSPDMAWALGEGAELLVHMINPMMPHLGEDCWQRLGRHTLLADQPWPTVEAALLVDDEITMAVQVNGKRRDELRIARTATQPEVEAAALKLEGVIRALEGKPVRKIIVVPQRIVNVVV
jgi:leucyl-tRNA synthetase